MRVREVGRVKLKSVHPGESRDPVLSHDAGQTNRLGNRSSQPGLPRSIISSFQFRFHSLIWRSRLNAASLRLVNFEPDQNGHAMLGREARPHLVAMLAQPLAYIIGRTGVEGSVPPTGDDVGVEGQTSLRCEAKELGPGFRRDERGWSLSFRRATASAHTERPGRPDRAPGSGWPGRRI